MKVIFVNQQQLKVGLIVLIMTLITAGFWLNSEQLSRRIFGVKSGVRVEGRNIAGMLPEEVTRFVVSMAEKVNRQPQDASFFPETGEIIPAKPGKMVKVAETVHRICLAKANSNLNLVTTEVAPQIADDFFKPVYHGNQAVPKVAFALNVAWGEEYLPDILNIFRQEKVKATFFFVGTWVKAFPEMVKEIADAGHEIANHGLRHQHVVQMGREEIKGLIADNALLLTESTGKAPPKLFAPPYGEVNPLIVSAASELGYRTIMWSVDSLDWKNPTPEALINRVMSKIEPGGIILVHPTIASRAAFRPLIRELRKKGLEPVTVSEILK